MHTKAGLLQRAETLTGHTLERLALHLGCTLPQRLLHHKGLIGQMVEVYLGAQGGSRPEPDFKHLGVELKTLPLNPKGQPVESTYVCAVPLCPDARLKERHWKTSSVYQKLQTVLIVPFSAYPKHTISAWRFQKPFMLSLPPAIEVILKQDWEELMECLVLGEAADLSASRGTYLHIRPKAAHSRVQRRYLTQEGEFAWVVPKGFYLRPSFIKACLELNSDKTNCLLGKDMGFP